MSPQGAIKGDGGQPQQDNDGVCRVSKVLVIYRLMPHAALVQFHVGLDAQNGHGTGQAQLKPRVDDMR
eukprot:scaffold5524_cov175-Amphora_coffeaeformis.AAC.5